VNDATLCLLPFATINVASVVNQPGKFLGRNRAFNLVGRIGGDVTGAGAALTFTIEECTTLGGTYTTVPGTGTVTLTEMVGTGGSAPKPEIPGALPVRVPITTTKDFVRITTTAAGTTPVFPGVSVYADPIDNPMLPSGR
jgi:hypothetical protein